MVLVLSVIAFFAALTLASVYSLTRESINSSQLKNREKAIRAVLPKYDHVSLKPIEMNNGVETTKVYKAYDKNNNIVGAAVESTSNNGYNGHLDIIVGFNKAGVIINYTVLEQHETLGLGARMVDWFKTEKGHQDIRGKNAGIAHLDIRKDGGEVDAITAATITSRAFLFAVRNAYFEFKLNLDASEAALKNETDTLIHKTNDSISTVSKIEMKGQMQ